MLVLALLAAVQAAPDPGPIKTFGDWAVACDNIRRCEMTALIPEAMASGEDSGFDASISVMRDAGPAGGFTIEAGLAEEVRGTLTLRVDGTMIARASAARLTVRFTGADAARAVAAMANGSAIELVDPSGKRVARASLAGSSAALRFIDAEQGRAGTVTAAVAKGAKPAGAVPVAAPLPQVAGLRPSGTAATVSRAMRTSMEKAAGCEGMYDGIEGGPPEVETFALGGGKTLALVPCGAGAYNFSTGPFIIASGKAEPAEFDYAAGGMGGSDDATLVNAAWDADQATLSTFAKGRGIGDCGSSEAYVWDGRRFRLVEARLMPECRGSGNWLAIWRARPVLR